MSGNSFYGKCTNCRLVSIQYGLDELPFPELCNCGGIVFYGRSKRETLKTIARRNAQAGEEE